MAAFAQRGSDGELLAAGVLRRKSDDELRFIGMVDPAARGRGIGGALLDLALAAARDAAADQFDAADASLAADAASGVGLALVVESEALSDAADGLFVSRGLRRTFAEDTLRCDTTVAERPELADGMELVEWSNETAERFYAVYRAAFRERPDFADESAQEWIEDYGGRSDFRPQWSLLLSLAGFGDAGFIAVTADWIGEVGVVPTARRRGIAELLVRETLTRMAAAGTPHVELSVAVDNPGAAALYRRIGFVDRGRQARYRLRVGPVRQQVR
ncbi:GNAT family N-acetyltransferase [Actinoplanes sp. NPDC051859]|uniref:GNAT family N-acetyltransferase n=1 Tax=Actinoplanes sp. NPDC051859 TaxID=3363909 RepID=UPI0037A058ED